MCSFSASPAPRCSRATRSSRRRSRFCRRLEGLDLVTPIFDPYVLPITVLILVSLFFVQQSGTARVATFFGPIMLVFFVVIAILGIMHIGDAPRIFQAFNPIHGLAFLLGNGFLGFVVLGSVFLAVTGAEALYADMGHFGRFPIQAAWLVFVLPSLILNYLGQGALVLSNPKTVENPFFLLAPSWGLLPLVILSTAATVIASQAVITGAFSLARQAIQLGLLPRMLIQHTSETLEGQIFIPRVNRMLLVGVLALVLLFKNSSALANAYGIAVTGTMVVTTMLSFVVVWRPLEMAVGGPPPCSPAPSSSSTSRSSPPTWSRSWKAAGCRCCWPAARWS